MPNAGEHRRKYPIRFGKPEAASPVGVAPTEDSGGQTISAHRTFQGMESAIIKEKEVLEMKNSVFVIEQAREEDAAALLEYLKVVGGETENLSFGEEGLSTDLAAEQAYLRAQCQSADNVQYLAKVNGEIIGTASLNRKPRRMRHRGEFGISLKKAWWGCGAGSALTEAVLSFARENGFEQLNLEVRSDNARAIRLYEKYGFRKLCTFPGFFKVNGACIDVDLMNLALPPAGDRP